jgi:ankyrin repeat protein
LLSSYSGADVNTRAKLVVDAKDGKFVLHGVTALTSAALNGDAIVSRILIEHGADFRAVDSRGASIMLWARSNEVVQVLLDHGLDIDARDEDGLTLLILASADANTHKLGASGISSHGMPDVAFLLLHGADPNAKTKTGLTALKAAQGRPELVELLKNAGAKQ